MPPTIQEYLSYYSTPNALSELPVSASRLFDGLSGLPFDDLLKHVCERVQSCIVHPFLFHIYPDVAEHPSNSSLPIPERLGPERAALETALRPCSQICARIAQLGHGDNGTRSKFMGVCRHFTLLASAILRHLKVPARSRVGFAGYFSKQWEDHWILEAWDPSAENWRSIDPQLDPLLLSKLNTDREFKIDPINLPRGLASRGFATGTEAYLGCTDGGYNANEFGIENVRGLFFIEGDAVLDFLALSKMELLPWDALPSHFLSLPTDSPTRKQHLSRLLNLISIMDSTHPSSEEHLKAWEEARGMFEEGEGYLRPNWELEGLVDVRKMGPPPPS